MSFFDEFLSTTKSVASTAGKKGDDAVKFSKLKLKAAQINSEIKDKYKIVGSALPILVKKIGMDPAVMASPFITTIVDAISLLIYFKIATLVLGI